MSSTISRGVSFSTSWLSFPRCWRYFQVDPLHVTARQSSVALVPTDLHRFCVQRKHAHTLIFSPNSSNESPILWMIPGGIPSPEVTLSLWAISHVSSCSPSRPSLRDDPSTGVLGNSCHVTPECRGDRIRCNSWLTRRSAHPRKNSV